MGSNQPMEAVLVPDKKLDPFDDKKSDGPHFFDFPQSRLFRGSIS